MKHFGILLMLSIFGIPDGQCQKVEQNSLEHLAFVMEQKIGQYDVATKTRTHETMLLFFEVDSAGAISAIHIMSDENKRDSSYYAVKKVRPSDLQEWKGVSFKGKVIIMPINTFGIVDGSGQTGLQSKSIDYLSKGTIPAFAESGDWKANKGSAFVMGPNIKYQWKFSGRQY